MCVSTTGILAPVTGASFLVIVLQDTDTREEDRVLWCKILLISSHIIVTFYALTLFFNFLYRVVLILFSDRGLIVRGRPDMTLFRQLYWTVFWAFFCMLLFMYVYSSSQISVDPFTGSIVGNICLQQPLEASANSIKGRVVMLAFASITGGYNQYYSWRVRSYLRGVSPRARYFSLGRYRRNLLSFQQTSACLSAMILFAFFKLGLSLIPLLVAPPGLSPKAMFWLNNGSIFLYINILHGVILPMKMEVPPAHKEVARRTQFYVRSPGLPCPRRDFETRSPACMSTSKPSSSMNASSVLSSSMHTSSMPSSIIYTSSMPSRIMLTSSMASRSMYTSSIPLCSPYAPSMTLSSMNTSRMHPISMATVSD